MSGAAESGWPALPLDEWRDTCATLHRWTQVVGKVRMAKTPPINHWWHVALYGTGRGLTTGPIPDGARVFQIDFDFVGHRLAVPTRDGGVAGFDLEPMSVAAFHARAMAMLADLGIEARIWPVPVEIPDPIPFADDETHTAYDAGAANRFWRALTAADRATRAVRDDFLGKASPVHFFWGSFDLAYTRFSGRPAPPHPGVPVLPDFVTREAYSHECWSAGWWPGEGLGEPAFYAYAYPTPEGLGETRVEPSAAYWSEALGEFLLPYDAVRRAPDPDRAVTRFLRSTYDAVAGLGGWDRSRLDRRRQ